jgi:plasmid rolling circle replication initiator protein Rep
MMWRARFIKKLPLVLQEYPKTRFLFLTLTIKNCDLKELRATLARINKAWITLTKRKDFPAFGWLKAVEVTRGVDGTAHPHLHCLLLVKPSYFGLGYLSQAAWTALWKDCLGIEYDPVVNIKVVKDRKKKSKAEVQELCVPEVQVGEVPEVSEVPEVPGLSRDIMAGVLETLKYTVKPSDLAADPDWLIELTKQMHNTRAIGLGGVLKEYMSEKEPDDLIHGDLDEAEEILEEDMKLIFEWAEITKRYARQKAD